MGGGGGGGGGVGREIIRKFLTIKIGIFSERDGNSRSCIGAMLTLIQISLKTVTGFTLDRFPIFHKCSLAESSYFHLEVSTIDAKIIM